MGFLLLDQQREMRQISKRLEYRRRALDQHVHNTRARISRKVSSPLGLLGCFTAGFISSRVKLRTLNPLNILNVFPLYKLALNTAQQFTRGLVYGGL